MIHTDFNTLLLRSFDEELTANELKLLQDELEHSTELQHEEKAIINMRKMMDAYEPGFGNEFTEGIFKRTRIGNILFIPNQISMIFKRVSILAAAAIILLLVMVYWQDQSLDLNSLLGLSDLHPEDFDNLFANY